MKRPFRKTSITLFTPVRALFTSLATNLKWVGTGLVEKIRPATKQQCAHCQDVGTNEHQTFVFWVGMISYFLCDACMKERRQALLARNNTSKIPAISPLHVYYLREEAESC